MIFYYSIMPRREKGVFTKGKASLLACKNAGVVQLARGEADEKRKKQLGGTAYRRRPKTGGTDPGGAGGPASCDQTDHLQL